MLAGSVAAAVPAASPTNSSPAFCLQLSNGSLHSLNATMLGLNGTLGEAAHNYSFTLMQTTNSTMYELCGTETVPLTHANAHGGHHGHAYAIIIAVFFVLFTGALTRFALSELHLPYTVILCIIGAILSLASMRLKEYLELYYASSIKGTDKNAVILGQTMANILYEFCDAIYMYGNVDAHLVL